MTNEDLGDLDLARRISNGDEKALKNLYDNYADFLFAYITHLLNEAPRVVIEDIWQETLLSAIKSMASFRGDSRLFTWMCGIAKRKVFDYCRERRAHTHSNDLGYVYSNANLIDTNILPEDYVLQRVTRQHVIKTLGILPVMYQIILIQRYIDGSSVEEIAKSIGKTYKATESLLSRARQAFKSAFIKLSNGERDE
jgi:RNA polymerase sigma-70 factor (ECF subfamily)